jgi:hypothetical protein
MMVVVPAHHVLSTLNLRDADRPGRLGAAAELAPGGHQGLVSNLPTVDPVLDLRMRNRGTKRENGKLLIKIIKSD